MGELELPRYPRMVRVTGHPVHVAPELHANYFFFDGHYWLLRPEGWYTSTWYSGPWDAVRPERVPDAVLQIPVGAYRLPPAWFEGWRVFAPPRWDEHWGEPFRSARAGWQQRDRSHPTPAMPPPVYQRHYNGADYPGREQQRVLNPFSGQVGDD